MDDSALRLLERLMCEAERGGDREQALYIANILSLAKRAGED